MFLEEVVIEGFKSYGERTSVGPMDRTFTAITGLNGTGKSNILDAVCFVLGIDCPRLLRSGSMRDLIYKHKKTGQGEAKVTLVFNNKVLEGSPPGYEDVKMISLTRVIFEDGKTKYLLNGHNTTSKSVSRLLQSVGLTGSKGGTKEDETGRRYERPEAPYFVVMQGRVGRILSMKSSQFLGLLEECAGTSVYRAEKQKAYSVLEKKEKKLQETQETLSKTIFPFLERLRREKTEYYAYREAQKNLGRVRSSIEKHRNTILHLEQKKRESERGALEARRLEIEEAEERLEKALQTNKSSIEDTDIVEIQREIDRRKRSVSEMLLDVLEGEQEKLRAQKARNEEAVRRLMEEYKKQALAAGMAPADSLEDAAAGVEAHTEGLEEQERMTRKEVSTGKRSRAEREREREKSQKKIDECRKEIEKIREEIEIIEERHMMKQGDAELNVEMHRKSPAEEIPEIRRRIEKIKAEITYPLIEGVHGKMSELVSVPDDAYTVAVGVVLGSRRDFVVVEDETVGRKVIEIMTGQGRRVDVIPLSKIVQKTLTLQKEEAAQRMGGTPLIRAVKYAPEMKRAVEYVFGGYVLAPDRKTAVELRDKEDLTSITVDGEVFDRRGTVTGGSVDRGAIAFSERKVEELQRLEEALKRAKETLAVCSIEKLQDSKKLVLLEKEKKEAEKNLQRSEIVLAALSTEGGADEEELEKIAARLASLRRLLRQMKEAKEQKSAQVREEDRLEAQIGEKRKKAAEIEREIEELELKKREGVKRNETNRARRSIQTREERRIAEELSEIRRERAKNEMKLEKIAEQDKEEIARPDKDLVREGLEKLSERLRELETEHAVLSKTPQKDVNPKNVEMLEKNEELEKALKERIEKLKKDKETIQKSIEKLNALEKDTIEKVFESVNLRVGKYVQYFIPNGDARLEAPSGSPINGVELLVKMGTWKKGLTELSGGQRSICALSLIFSLLKSRPSPLYILDEIDAALDASHTEAMGRMVQKEFQGSQFLVVSLKDGMYRNANALFQTYIREGTSGVSKI